MPDASAAHVGRMLRRPGCLPDPGHPYRENLAARMLARAVLVPGTGCVSCTYAADKDTYSLVDCNVGKGWRKTRFGAHVLAFTFWVGDVPPEWEIDHRPECVKSCMLPGHLELIHQDAHRRQGGLAAQAKRRARQAAAA
jgi:hypothetical protein